MKITVIGNAIVDIIQAVDDSFLSEHGMVKGSMSLIDKERANELKRDAGEDSTLESGGSGANTAVGIAHCGGDVSFIGNVARDVEGDFFVNSLKAEKVNYAALLTIGEESTAKSFIYTTPDAERTMNTYLGISTNIFKENLNKDVIKDSGLLYVEGYLYDTPNSQDTLLYACKMAKESGSKIAFTLSDSFCVDRHREDFLSFIKDNVDILFCNEKEVLSLFETEDINISMNSIKDMCEITAITLGERGSVVVSQDERIQVACEPIDKLVDTTGAGDSYAAGFLYGYSQNRLLAECGKLGSELSAKVIQKMGATV